MKPKSCPRNMFQRSASLASGKTMLTAFVALTALICGPKLSAKADDTIHFSGSGNSAAVTISLFGGAGEATSAGDYNVLVNGSQTPIVVFCSDPYDSIYAGENWTAQKGLTSTLLPTTNYPHGGAKNIPALDYIAQFYTPQPNAPAPSAAAAQLAIWDLVTGGRVGKSGSVYSWDTSTFQVTSGFATASDQTDLAQVYTIEQNALYVNPGQTNLISRTGSSGSTIWIPEQVNGHWSSTDSSYGREQDLLTATLSPKNAVPEPGHLAMLGGLGVSVSLFAFGHRRRHKKRRSLLGGG